MSNCIEPNACKYDQIINAAVAEFQEKGFSAARMNDVSLRAGVSKRTVYKYFESKEKLFQSIIDALADRFAGVLDIRYQKGRPIRDQLIDLAWAEGQLLISAEVMAMARMIISETMRNPELAEAAQGKIDKTSVFISMLKEASANGELSIESPEEAAVEFIGLIKSKAFWPVIFGAPLATEEQMSRIVESSVDMMLCRYRRR